MKLFHGSNAVFDKVSLDFSRGRRDFGRGFYTTSLREQAKEWAESMCRRYRTQTAYLYEFELSLTGLTVKKFDAMTKDWLDFILENRMKREIGYNYDVVIGPVANDRTVNTLSLYMDGELTLEETLARLTYMQANNQISMHTRKALDNLFFLRREEWKL
jgi:hypothetical protein